MGRNGDDGTLDVHPCRELFGLTATQRVQKSIQQIIWLLSLCLRLQEMNRIPLLQPQALALSLRTCWQVVDSDLIGALAGAVRLLLAARPNGGAWLELAQLVLDPFVRVHALLHAASVRGDVDASVVDAGWKRCAELGIHDDVIKVRALMPVSCSAMRVSYSLCHHLARQARP